MCNSNLGTAEVLQDLFVCFDRFWRLYKCNAILTLDGAEFCFLGGKSLYIFLKASFLCSSTCGQWAANVSEVGPGGGTE